MKHHNENINSIHQDHIEYNKGIIDYTFHKIAHIISYFMKFILVFFVSIFVSLALLVSSFSFFFFAISSSLGLSESESYKQFRESFFQRVLENMNGVSYVYQNNKNSVFLKPIDFIDMEKKVDGTQDMNNSTIGKGDLSISPFDQTANPINNTQTGYIIEDITGTLITEAIGTVSIETGSTTNNQKINTGTTINPDTVPDTIY